MSFLARRLRLRLAQHLVLRLDLFVKVADRSCSTESLAGFFCQASRPGAPSASDRRPWGCKPSSSRSFESGLRLQQMPPQDGDVIDRVAEV